MPLAEYNDVTRMTRHQLADRIRQMETTRARNSTVGAPNERHRPMEDRRRSEKIAIYKEELRRRELADDFAAAIERGREIERQPAAAIAQQPTPDARKLTPEQRTAKDLEEFTARLKAQADARPVCDWCEGTGTVILPGGNDHTSRRCSACGGSGKQEAPAMSYRDIPINHDAMSQTLADDAERRQREADAAERRADQDGPPDFTPVKHAPITAPPPLRVACPQCGAAIGDTCHNANGYPCSPHTRRKLALQLAEEAAAAEPAPPIAEQPTPDARPDPIEAARRKLEARLSVPCPQCHAAAGARCTNYKGDHCHPHGARKAPADARADVAQAKHAAKDATAARRRTVAEIRTATADDSQAERPRGKAAEAQAEADARAHRTPEAQAAADAAAEADRRKPRPAPTPETPRRPGLSNFDLAVEALVRDHTLSSVLDAAWAASKRLFNPIGATR